MAKVIEEIKHALSKDQIKAKVEEAVKSVSTQADRFSKLYTESGFQDKLKTFGTKVGSNVLYPVILLYSALSSPKASIKDKLTITAALGYFILPADLIPDILVGIGYADDLAAITAALAVIKHLMTPEVFEQTSATIRKIFGTVDNNELRDFIAESLDVELEEDRPEDSAESNE